MTCNLFNLTLNLLPLFCCRKIRPLFHVNSPMLTFGESEFCRMVFAQLNMFLHEYTTKPEAGYRSNH